MPSKRTPLVPIGSRITFLTHGHVGTGTVRKVERRNRRPVYLLHESSIVVDRDEVIETHTPDQIKNDVVSALLTEEVAENIKQSSGRVRRHAQDNAPYITPNPEYKSIKVGRIRI